MEGDSEHIMIERHAYCGKVVMIIQYSSNNSGSTNSAQLSAEAVKQLGALPVICYAFEGPFSRENKYRTLVVSHKPWLRSERLGRFVKNVLYEIPSYTQFQKIFKDEKPDLVYINTMVSLPAAAAAKALQIPVLWHIRELFDDAGGEMKIPLGLGKRFVTKIINYLATNLIVVSEAVLKNVFANQSTPNVSLIPNAIDARYFMPSYTKADGLQQLGCSDLNNRPVIGVPGTLRPMKGHKFLLSAVPLVLLTFPNAFFLISGSGQQSYIAELQALVANLEISDFVKFTGSIDDMIPFYDASDIVCIPSEAEPFGRTVIEAFARKKAIVASNVGGIAETIQSGHNGCLVKYGDTAALARQIVHLLNHGDVRFELGENAHADARCKFHDEQYIKAIQEVIVKSFRPDN